MKLTSLIFAAAGFCSLLPALTAAENYSLWPRRPAELEQARRLACEQKVDEAVALLAPFVGERGIAGREARQLSGAINVHRYLSRLHPHATVRKVGRGDTLERIAVASRCPSDIIMLLNGMVEPSSLRAGQKLVTVEMSLRMEIHLEQREISVWDGETLVADYNILSAEGVEGRGQAETLLAVREGSIKGKPVSRRSAYYPASDRMLGLENGIALVGEQERHGKVLRMDQHDLSELAMLLGVGAQVSIFYQEPEHPLPSAAR